jgi:hypothetical protein
MPWTTSWASDTPRERRWQPGCSPPPQASSFRDQRFECVRVRRCRHDLAQEVKKGSSAHSRSNAIDQIERRNGESLPFKCGYCTQRDIRALSVQGASPHRHRGGVRARPMEVLLSENKEIRRSSLRPDQSSRSTWLTSRRRISNEASLLMYSTLTAPISLVSTRFMIPAFRDHCSSIPRCVGGVTDE